MCNGRAKIHTYDVQEAQKVPAARFVATPAAGAPVSPSGPAAASTAAAAASTNGKNGKNSHVGSLDARGTYFGHYCL